MIQPSQADIKSDYDNYVARAITLIHAPQTTTAVQNILTAKDPVGSVARACVMIMQRLDTAARTAGIEVQDSVKLFAADEIIKLITELAEAARKFQRLPPKLHELALAAAVQDYVKGEIAAGRIDPRKLEAEVNAGIQKLPPEEQKAIQEQQLRIQQTGKQYGAGR